MSEDKTRSKVIAEELSLENVSDWDAFLEDCEGATFYQSAKFQEHYRDKCDRTAYILFREKGKILAGLSGGICDEDGAKVLRSPFSASFAGFAFPSYPGAEGCLEIVDALHAWCSHEGISEVEIQQTPDIYGPNFCDLVEYCLRRRGYSLQGAELSHVVHLRPDPESQFTYAATKNYKRGLSVNLRMAPSADLGRSYDLIKENRARKGGVPSLSREDYLALTELFKDRIRTFSVYHEDQEVGAGVFYALSRKGIMAFWWAHSEDAQIYRPVNYLACEVAKWAYGEGYRAFDLGTTSDGGVLNPGLARFKESLGARAFLRRRFRHRLG